MTVRTDAFRRLHRRGDPLLLPNAWDYGSAAALVSAGHPAIGLAGLGVARVSTGSLLYRVALGAAMAAIGVIERGEHPGPDRATPSYADVQRLLN